MSIQHLVILAREESSGDGLAAIGTRDEILERLADLNTAPERDGDDVLYGPGIRMEMPPGEPVTQILLTVVEEEIAWHVILRLARTLGWKLYDPASQREFSQP